MGRTLLNILFGLAVTAVVFIILEVVLWAAGIKTIYSTSDPFVGYSSSLPLFVRGTDSAGNEIMKTAPGKLSQFNFQTFPVKKSRKAFRVFCLGGSTTYGRPYNDAVSFSGWLRAFLPAADSSREWEVINAGGISYASYRIAQLMEELIQYKPDLFIVYSGHNEFLEERTYRDLAEMPAVIRESTSLLGRTHVYSGMQALYKHLGGDPLKEAKKRYEMTGEVKTILELTYGPKTYTRNDSLRRQVLQHYGFSLDRIVRLSKSAGARVLLSTIPVNIKDCTPFKSEHKAGLGRLDAGRFNVYMSGAENFSRDGKPEEAFRQYEKALEIDGRFAEAWYRAGKVLLSMGKTEKAQQYLLRALEEDVCPLRALQEIQEQIRATARKEKTLFLDYDRILGERILHALGYSIPGNEDFLDHVHLTINNHRLLALDIIQILAREGILKLPGSQNADWQERVTREVNGRVDDRARGIALHNLAKVLNWAGKYEDAVDVAVKALTFVQDDLQAFPSYLYVGTAHDRNGELDSAIFCYQRALAIDSNNSEAHGLAAYAFMRKKEWPEAEYHLLAAYRFSPGNPDLLRKLSLVWDSTGNSEAAIGIFSEAVQHLPNDPEMHFELGKALRRGGRSAEAKERLQQALRLYPGHAGAYVELGKLAKADGDRGLAVKYFAQALKLNPRLGEARALLTSSLPPDKK